MKTPEELMKQRYIVIADWPQGNINPFHVGDILEEQSIYFTRINNAKSIHRDEIVKYPHLFKRLCWWEERKPQEMPEYVKRIGILDRSKFIFDRVKEWAIEKDNLIGISEDNKMVYPPWLQPATEEEYLEYTKQSNI